MTIMKKIIVFTTIGLALIIAGLLIPRVSGGEKSTTPPVVPSEKIASPIEEEAIEISEGTIAPEAPKVKSGSESISITEAPVPDPVDPYWMQYIKEQSLKGGFYLAAYTCIIEWESNLVPSKATGMHKVVKFMRSAEAEKDAAVVAIFQDTYQNQPCTEMTL